MIESPLALSGTLAPPVGVPSHTVFVLVIVFVILFLIVILILL